MKDEIMNPFVNIYKDDKGRFISDEEYSTWREAFDNKDDISTYSETVQILRLPELTQIKNLGI